jgi:hypothetical protein
MTAPVTGSMHGTGLQNAAGAMLAKAGCIAGYAVVGCAGA